MTFHEEILLNKYGQDLIKADLIEEIFNSSILPEKRDLLVGIVELINQSKPTDDDIETVIVLSDLRPTFTPCVLLRKGVANHNLLKIINLPEDELNKVLLLLLNLFKVAYQRRFQNEKNNGDKWWYSDLSSDENIRNILKYHSN